jgi:DNA gyrase subunit B
MASPETPNDPAYTEHSSGMHVVESIRLRPGIYIGNTGAAGLRAVLFGLINRVVDDARTACAKRITVELLADGGCRVSDDGEGIPVHPVRGGMRFVEGVMTHVMIWGRDADRYRFSSGVHGRFDLPTANALSRRCVVEVRRDGWLWRQEYERGRPLAPLVAVRPAAATGTSISFWPDPDIFEQECAFSYPLIRDRLHELACLNPGLFLDIRDERSDPPLEESFCSPDGLVDLLRHRTLGLVAVHPTVAFGEAKTKEGEFGVAFAWFRRQEEGFFAFANGILTPQGGSHLTGFRHGMTRTGRRLLPKNPRWSRRRGAPNGEVIRLGLFAVVAVRLEDPMFSGALRGTLNNVQVEWPMRSLTSEVFDSFFRDHPDEADAIVEHLRDSLLVDPKTGMP